MTNTSTVPIDKGGVAEEALRQYFLDLGSFVVRGVPVREAREPVTDIDLWVYTRTSPHSRHVSIVDIKNKKRSKGLERAIWVRGLQCAVDAQEAIIATTGQREAISSFANRLGVKVMAPDTFRAIINKYGGRLNRISNEEIFARWKSLQLRGAESVKSRIEASLSEIAHGITFQALNGWIDDSVMFFALSLDRERSAGDLMRAALFCSSLVALGADFLGREQSFAEQAIRAERFRQGLLFGRTDATASNSYINFAEKLVTENFDPTGAVAATLRAGFEKSLSYLNVKGLVDFFSRPASGKELIDGAISLEAAAFSPGSLDISAVRTEGRMIVGLLLDYAGLPRQKVLTSGLLGSSNPSSDTDTPILSTVRVE